MKKIVSYMLIVLVAVNCMIMTAVASDSTNFESENDGNSSIIERRAPEFAYINAYAVNFRSTADITTNDNIICQLNPGDVIQVSTYQWYNAKLWVYGRLDSAAGDASRFEDRYGWIDSTYANIVQT